MIYRVFHDGLIGLHLKATQAAGHESQLQKHTTGKNNTLLRMSLQLSLPFIFRNTHCVLKGGEGGQRGLLLTRHHANIAKTNAYLHDATVYLNATMEVMQSVKEGGKEKQRERVTERACLDKEKYLVKVHGV